MAMDTKFFAETLALKQLKALSASRKNKASKNHTMQNGDSSEIRTHITGLRGRPPIPLEDRAINNLGFYAWSCECKNLCLSWCEDFRHASWNTYTFPVLLEIFWKFLVSYSLLTFYIYYIIFFLKNQIFIFILDTCFPKFPVVSKNSVRNCCKCLKKRPIAWFYRDSVPRQLGGGCGTWTHTPGGRSFWDSLVCLFQQSPIISFRGRGLWPPSAESPAGSRTSLDVKFTSWNLKKVKFRQSSFPFLSPVFSNFVILFSLLISINSNVHLNWLYRGERKESSDYWALIKTSINFFII